MDQKAQGDPKDFFGTLDEQRQHQLTCVACHDCLSIHGAGPFVTECPLKLKDCNVCTNLARINKEISSTYKRLTDLVKERRNIMVEPPHGTPAIERVPVEILCSIFIFVNEATFYSNGHPDDVVPQSLYKQPSHSPPLVGAVCRRWRDITLTTQRLWTEIRIDLDKSAEGQLNMLKSWTHRSGTLPLNFSIVKQHGTQNFNARHATRTSILQDYLNILSDLRSVAARWNNIALDVPDLICWVLFNRLEVDPTVLNRLVLSSFCENLHPIILRHPLRPTQFISMLFTNKIPTKWDRLVTLDIEKADRLDLLDIIRQAPNLKHLNGRSTERFAMQTPPNMRIMSRSLISLKTSGDFIAYLSLPSLQRLDYNLTLQHPADACLDHIAEFIKCSRPPLVHFILRVYVKNGRPLPNLEKLSGSGLTSLSFTFVDGGHFHPHMEKFLLKIAQTKFGIFPHLKELSFDVCEPSPNAISNLSWKVLSYLWYVRPDARTTSEAVPATSVVKSAPRITLSKLHVCFWNRPQLEFVRQMMDKATFKRLLQGRRLGMDLRIMLFPEDDLVPFIAQAHGVVL